MVAQPKKRKRSKEATEKSRTPEGQDLPPPCAVIEEEEFISPKGNKYRIIVTNELDAYEYDEEDPESS